MRQIKFRGKTTANGHWVYGSLIVYADNTCAIHNRKSNPWVQPDSIGQFTGLLDRNGKEIYEGDILRLPHKNKWEETSFVGYEVFWHDNDCCDHHIGFQMNRVHFYGHICGTGDYRDFKPKTTAQMEVIGNIYDNQELIGNEQSKS